MSIDRGTNKEEGGYLYLYTHHVYIYIYIVEYYSAIKRNEILPSVATWMQLEMIILSGVSQRKANTI